MAGAASLPFSAPAAMSAALATPTGQVVQRAGRSLAGLAPGQWGLPSGGVWTVLKVGLGVALFYAGYVHGRKVQKATPDRNVILPMMGWSLLGPVGPGYLVGRLTGG